MNRGSVGWLFGAIAVVAALVALYLYLSTGDDVPPLVLIELQGEVSVQRPDTKGVSAKEGLPLEASDRLTTGEGSRAVLGMGSETRIRLGPSSSVEVVSVDQEGVHLDLEDGALSATVRPSSGAVRVGSGGREVLATNGAFEFGVREGIIEVNAVEGDLLVQGFEGARLSEGTRATVIDGQSEIGPIPDKLLLDVAWPDALRQREKTTVFQGKTEPKAKVKVSGPFGEVRTVAGADGRFEVTVPLVEGENPVTVTAVDVLGNEVAASGALPAVDTLGPIIHRGGVEYHR